jgi:hypothetical protein
MLRYGSLIRISLLLPAVLMTAFAGALPQGVQSPFESAAALTPTNKIDEAVFGRLKQLGIRPANLSSDAVFIRRAYLDVIGTLPTAQEASAFLSDPDPEKRRALIERLLEREEFADYWAMKWGDLLRVKSEFPINLWPNAVQAYHRWIRTALKENLPYDRFVRELLTANGSNFRVPQVNFYRAVQSKDPQTIARAVALTFMGERAEKWPKERLAGMAAFFSQIGYKPTMEWKEEIVFFDPAKAPAQGTGAAAVAVFPDGKAARLMPNRDPRVDFADWLMARENPWFARNIVNRIWSWLLGRGIVHEPDDMRPDNPPGNPELLALLERELLAARFDLKHMYRLILNSQVYQLSCIPHSERPEAAASFAFYPMRRLDAEVLIDAICAITGTTEQYSSPIPEPFTFIPESQRSIALADGSITSAFLEIFGRAPRNTGLESERNHRPTAAQSLHLLNSSHVQLKIQQSARLRALVQPGGKPRDPINELYLTVLSRPPTDEELRIVGAYFQSFSGNRWPAVVDLVWALMNSAEFLFRH